MCLGPSHIDNYGIGYIILTVNSQRDITQSVGLKHEKVVTIDLHGLYGTQSPLTISHIILTSKSTAMWYSLKCICISSVHILVLTSLIMIIIKYFC